MSLAMGPMASLIDVSGQLLNLQVIEALMHQEIDANDLVKLVYSETPDRFKDAEEDCAEDGRPGDND